EAGAVANEGPAQPIGIVVQVLHRDDLRAHVAPAHRIVRVAADAGHPIAVHLDDDSTGRFADRAGRELLHAASDDSAARAAGTAIADQGRIAIVSPTPSVSNRRSMSASSTATLPAVQSS